MFIRDVLHFCLQHFKKDCLQHFDSIILDVKIVVSFFSRIRKNI